MDQAREEHAKRLLKDKLLNEAFNTLEESIMSTWNATSVRDVDAREQCWLSLRLLANIKVHLTSIIETGEMTKKFQEYQL